VTNPPEVLKRNRYFIESGGEVPHTSRDHADDMQEFHLPLMNIHQAFLHDVGIAGGLEVNVTSDGQAVEVQPGVAVDENGRLIVLSPDGKADVSLSEPGEADRQIDSPFRLDTVAGETTLDVYLTIQFAERLRLAEGVGGKLEQTPWLRLQPVAGAGAFVDDGSAIILAIVTVDADGVATLREQDPALPQERELMGSFTSELRIRRAVTTAGQVGQTLSANIGAETEGGLRVSVQEATDAVRFNRTGGDAFASFEVQADVTQLRGSLNVRGDQENQGSLRVTGVTDLAGDVRAAANLQVTGTIDASDIRQNGVPIVGSQWDTIGGGITFTGGNVGIGNPAPAERLDVTGRIKSGALSIGPWPPNPRYVFFGAGTLNQSDAGNYALLQGASDSVGVTFLNSPESIQFRIRNVDQMVLHKDGELKILANTNSVHFTSSWRGYPDGVINRAEISNDTGTYKTLMIVGNKSAGLGRRVSVWDRLEVNGTLSTTGVVGIGTSWPQVSLHVVGNRIRLTNAGLAHRYVDLRADGSALDLESRGGDLYINNHGLTYTRIRNFVNISSRDFKDQIVDLSAAEALELFGRLRAVKYHHKDDPNQRQQIGFVAEELPSLLTTPDQKAYKPTDILAILTMVIQSQQAQIQDLLKIKDTAKAATTPNNTKGTDEHARTV
jgi:hypothetical protein